jgi:hypothetical protein
MNYTNFEHAGYAVLMQLVIGFITGNWFAATCFPIAFFIGREHAQFQHKLGYSFKSTFEAFNVFKWSLDAQLDLLFPVIATVVVYAVVLSIPLI